MQQPKLAAKPSPLSKPQISRSPRSDGSSDSSSYTDEEEQSGENSPSARRSPGSDHSSAADPERESYSPAEPELASPSISASPRQLSRQVTSGQDSSATSSAALQMVSRESPTEWQQQRMQPASLYAEAVHSPSAVPAPQSECMHVAVRVRPIPPAAAPPCWIIDTTAGTITQNPNAASPKRKQTGLLPSAVAVAGRDSNVWETGSMQSAADSRVSTPSLRSTVFKFDTVLDATAQTQEAYSRCIRSMVQSALQGVNATILAYGEQMRACIPSACTMVLHAYFTQQTCPCGCHNVDAATLAALPPHAAPDHSQLEDHMSCGSSPLLME